MSAAHRFCDGSKRFLFFFTAILIAVGLVLSVNLSSSAESLPPAELFLLTLFAIACPTAIGTLHAFETQSEFERLAQRSASMELELKRLREEMGKARSLSEIRNVSRGAAEILLLEARDWLVLYRAHGVQFT